MNAHLEMSIVVDVDVARLTELFNVCNASPACKDWENEGDTYRIHLRGPIEANEELLARIQAL